MRKKVIIFIIVVIGLFAILAYVNHLSQSAAVPEDNPYGKSTLHSATIEQLDNPLYENQILPDELESLLAAEEDGVVYFYEPTCPYCEQATPTVVPLADEYGADLKLYNLVEFPDGWQRHQIESVPTVVVYENGEEKERIVGWGEEGPAVYDAWFEQFVADNFEE